MADQVDDIQVDQELEKEARLYGWKPEAEYKGKAPWIDAETYVNRGREIAPILRSNNERLKNDTLQLKTENGNLRTELEALRKDLNEFRDSATKKQVEEKRAQLVDQLKEAVKDDDVDAELKIREQLDALKVEPPKKPDVKPAPKDDGLHPDFKRWADENPWFGGTSSEDKKKTKEVTRIAEDLREEGTRLQGAEFMEAVVAEYDKRHADPDDDPNDKHQQGSNGVGRRQSGKGFASLPKEARDACHEDNDKFVGEGKLFKTQKEWETHYYEQYNS